MRGGTAGYSERLFDRPIQVCQKKIDENIKIGFQGDRAEGA